MKQNLIEQFNLPSYIKNKTFADASKAIEGKFKDRNDKVSKETKEALLERLSKAQEYIKMQESLKNESQQIPDRMNGQIPEGMEEFMPQQGQPQQEQVNPIQQQLAMGGYTDPNLRQPVTPIQTQQIGIDPNMQGAGVDTTMAGTGTPLGVEGGSAELGDVAGAAKGLLSAGQDIFGKPNVDTSGKQNYDIQAFQKNKLSKGVGGAANIGKGIVTGNPMDIIKGAGDLGSAIFGKGKSAMEEANHQYALGQNANVRQSDFALGGKVDPNIFGQPTEGTYSLAQEKPLVDPAIFGKPTGPYSNLDGSVVTPEGFNSNTKTKIGQGVDWLGQNAGNIAQYAPVASNLMSLKNLKRGATERGSRLDNTYQPQLYDQARLQNMLSQQNTERALTESSGGDLGALRSNLIGQGAAKTKALSEGMATADSVNRDENRFKFQADSAKDAANVNLDQDFLNRKAQDTGAYETTKANLKRQLAEDIGGIGKEEVDKKLVKELFNYKWNGEYYIDKDGKPHTKADIAKKVKNSEKK